MNPNHDKIAHDRRMRKKMNKICSTIHNLYMEFYDLSATGNDGKEYDIILTRIDLAEKELVQMRREMDCEH